MKHKNLSEANVTEIQNDYLQHQIYSEVRHNSDLEIWRHIFGSLGVVISIFGILGNIISLYILFKPGLASSRKYSLRQRTRPNFSFEYKLSSFYAYLTALSFCDLFSCIFAILNMLEYIPPPYLEVNLTKYREFCLGISVYTHPIATTLQALSVWLICAFSIHRCRSIVKPSHFLSSIKRRKCTLNYARTNSSPSQSYMCHVNLKNNCTQKTYELKFYSKKNLLVPLCWCSVRLSEHSQLKDLSLISALEKNTESLKSQVTTRKKVKKVKLTIIILYFVAIVYLIPQMFEKKLTSLEIQHKTYVFTTMTSFGQTRLFRQIFHLWFYMIAIYIFPFILIMVFNLVLLRAYFKSRNRCKKYKLNRDPSQILKDYNSVNTNCDEASKADVELKETTLGSNLAPKFSIASSLSFNKPSSSPNLQNVKNSHRGRALTLTLFGVVAIFFICHFPAAIAKIIYVIYPSVEFDKSAFASICLDLSNFLIMCNSSINFLLYIVFGPAKFRQEFGFIFMNVLHACRRDPARANRKNAHFNLTVDYKPNLRPARSCLQVNRDQSFSNCCSVENSFFNETSKNVNSNEPRPSDE
ncbi:FMRFamide receptor [Brachionus plicatilis]|uniref:FMRFamide receptor n=1 Tax=Brachionus plicatilis TaxID=10195 RepID=A0A3M7QMR6_BRAPC|nr:FMRFamide receptor [Brachionus plicatilis]